METLGLLSFQSKWETINPALKISQVSSYEDDMDRETL